MMDARKAARGYVEYFGESVQESANNPEDKLSKVRQHGPLVSQEWLRLLDAQSISEDEFRKFIGSVHASKYLSSARGVMARDVYAWAIQEGFSPPEEHEFFASSSYFVNDDLRSILSPEFSETGRYLDIANNIFASFEDSRNPIWKIGYEIAKEWVSFLNSEAPQSFKNE